MNEINSNRSAGILSKAAFFSLFLALIKFLAFWLSGSLLVLSSFFDSLSDMLVSFFNSRVAKFAVSSPDKDHPYGHGGFEVVSSLVQGAILATFGVILAVKGVDRLVNPEHSSYLDYSGLTTAIAVLVFSGIGGWMIHLYMKRQMAHSNGERSLSISADKAHYQSDAYMNLSAAIGAGLVWYYQKPILDAVFGLIGAGFLFSASYPVLKQALSDVLHSQANPDLQKKIYERVMGMDDRIKGIHRLRVREFGPAIFIDFHLKLPSEMTLSQAHEIGEKVHFGIRRSIPRADVVIHLDPDDEPDDELWDPTYKNH